MVTVRPTGEGPSEEIVDETLADSFPASDPPAWTLGRDTASPITCPENVSSAPPAADQPEPAASRNEGCKAHD